MNLLVAVLAAPLIAFLVALAMPRSSPQSSRMWALLSSLAIFAMSLFGPIPAEDVSFVVRKIALRMSCARVAAAVG